MLTFYISIQYNCDYLLQHLVIM